jgi:hypothetical protein
MQDLYDAISYTGPVVSNCYTFFYTTITGGTTGISLDGILLNILNNLGYMYTDVINVVNTTASSEADYPYFLAYNIGDFVIRIFWSNPVSYVVPGIPPKFYSGGN